MKKLFFLLLLCALPARATTYYLANASTSPAGNDSNNGTSPGTPWLSPNHALNCGDVIVAAASTSYAAANFANGKWGTVSCPGNNNVAWVKCVTFDACKISISVSPFHGMSVSSSYWGIQGWEVTTGGSNTYGDCFNTFPPTSTTTIHHIIFANNVANACQANGFGASNNGSAAFDYWVVVGNIAYNAASSTHECYSGITPAAMVNSDTIAGTHIYVAGNFIWNVSDGAMCGGSTPTDGEGINFDTIDGSSTGHPYTGQMVAYNNIVISNGNRGFEAFKNQNATPATLYVEYNTMWNNDQSSLTSSSICGELTTNAVYDITFSHNLAMTTAATACGGNTNWAYFISGGNGTVTVSSNWGYSAAGHNGGSQSSSGFAYGSNAFGTDPVFTGAATPGAPSCGSATSTTNCMATVIANFVPTTGGASAYGYQAVSGTSVTDALFPAWLCSVTNFPVGIITMGCGAPVNVPSVTGVKIQ